MAKRQPEPDESEEAKARHLQMVRAIQARCLKEIGDPKCKEPWKAIAALNEAMRKEAALLLKHPWSPR